MVRRSVFSRLANIAKLAFFCCLATSQAVSMRRSIAEYSSAMVIVELYGGIAS